MEIVAGILLVFATGFFEGSETAVYRAQWIRLTTWVVRSVHDGRHHPRPYGARLALRLLELREATVVACLVGANLTCVFASMFFSRFFALNFGPAYVSVAVVIVVILTLVFGQFLPKALAQSRPNHWLRRTSLPMAASAVLFAPAVLLLTGIARTFATPLAKTRARLSLTRQDILSAMRSALKKPVGGEGQPIASMVSRLFRFSGMKVGEAAIPLERVQSVPFDAGLKDLIALIEEHGFSRIPVYRHGRADIVGVIFARDLLAAPCQRIHRIDRVRQDARAMEILETMQRRGEHIAVVVDDKDQATGIVTLEDILEELVGEIRSEV